MLILVCSKTHGQCHENGSVAVFHFMQNEKQILTVLQYDCLASTFLKDTKQVKYEINTGILGLLNVNIDLINVYVHCATLFGCAKYVCCQPLQLI